MGPLYYGHFGTLTLVLITEISSIQRSLNTLQYYTGTRNGVLITEVPSIQRFVMERFHCTLCISMCKYILYVYIRRYIYHVWLVHTCVHVYVHTYIHTKCTTYVRMYICIYIHSVHILHSTLLSLLQLHMYNMYTCGDCSSSASTYVCSSVHVQRYTYVHTYI